MKKIIRLTESDLARIVKRTINEMEDEDFMRGADRNWEDRMEDEDDDYKDRSMYSPYYGNWESGDESYLQELLDYGSQILESECGMDYPTVSLMEDWQVVDALYGCHEMSLQYGDGNMCLDCEDVAMSIENLLY